MDKRIIDEEIMKELEKKLSTANAYEERGAIENEYLKKVYKEKK